MSFPATFDGYPRNTTRAGVRNHFLVFSATGLTGPTARRIAAQLHGALVICMPHDTGLLGEDRLVAERALEAFVTHPNVGAVLVVGGNQPKVSRLAQVAAQSGRASVGLSLDECGHDAHRLTEQGVRAGAKMVRDLSGVRRQPVPITELFVALECGRSDPSSGLVANPLLGLLSDSLVDAGGSAVIGETVEWLGAEHLLAKRGINEAVRARIREAPLARERMAIDAGIDLLGNNPGPTNIAAGLSSIEEKSLGNIAKSGSQPIQSVLGYGEPPARAGFHLMDAPAYAPESLTGFTIAHAQLSMFTTGVGNSFVNLLNPTIKLSANPHTTSRLQEQIDFDASAALTGEQSLDTVAAELIEHVVRTANGLLTFGEVHGEGEEVVSRFGAAL